MQISTMWSSLIRVKKKKRKGCHVVISRQPRRADLCNRVCWKALDSINNLIRRPTLDKGCRGFCRPENWLQTLRTRLALELVGKVSIEMLRATSTNCKKSLGIHGEQHDRTGINGKSSILVARPPRQQTVPPRCRWRYQREKRSYNFKRDF